MLYLKHINIKIDDSSKFPISSYLNNKKFILIKLIFVFTCKNLNRIMILAIGKKLLFIGEKKLNKTCVHKLSKSFYKYYFNFNGYLIIKDHCHLIKISINVNFHSFDPF